MQITRTNHLRYMAKMTPFLVGLYLLQVFIYQRFAPGELASDVSIFLGVGLAMIILAYQYYDLNHKVIFNENYLEVRFDILKMKEEILYQNIELIEVKKKSNYGHIILHNKNGTLCQLHHVDAPEEIVEFIEKKKARLL